MSRYIVCQHPQGTDGWKADRLGKVTGSRVAAVFAKVKSGEAATRANYRMDLVLERLTQEVQDGFSSADMEWGTENEPIARLAYEAESGLEVTECGFCYLPDLATGCSVDGFITEGDRIGVFENKCPKSKTHFEYIVHGKVPSIYVPQVTHNLWITGAEFADFQSYDPRFPPGLQRMAVRVERNDSAIALHEEQVLEFLAEVADFETQLRLRCA